jgi:hypothetical protein
VHAAEQFTKVERKEAKLMSVPERVPEVRIDLSSLAAQLFANV